MGGNLGEIEVNRNRKGIFLRHAQQMGGNMIHAALKQNMSTAVDNI